MKKTSVNTEFDVGMEILALAKHSPKCIYSYTPNTLCKLAEFVWPLNAYKGIIVIFNQDSA